MPKRDGLPIQSWPDPATSGSLDRQSSEHANAGWPRLEFRSANAPHSRNLCGCQQQRGEKYAEGHVLAIPVGNLGLCKRSNPARRGEACRDCASIGRGRGHRTQASTPLRLRMSDTMSKNWLVLRNQRFGRFWASSRLPMPCQPAEQGCCEPGHPAHLPRTSYFENAQSSLQRL